MAAPATAEFVAQIAPILGCSSAAARQLASRARRRLKEDARIAEADPARQRAVVAVGISDGRLASVLSFAVAEGRIIEIDILADPKQLASLHVTDLV